MAPCPPSSVLEGLFQGTLAPAEHSALEHHLDGCGECTATLAELTRLFGSASWGASAQDWSGAAPTLRGTSTLESPTLGSAPQPSTPLEFGRYRLGQRLGAGGMGVVFEAHDPELERRVALKLLHPGQAADAEQTRARLLHEARAMARLAHPNVVAVYDVGRAGEQIFLAMELVEGATLMTWLQAGPKRARKAILDIFTQAGRGLEAAHRVGLVHRDFKPDNVLVGSEGRARVTDFGLAMPTPSGPEGQDLRPAPPRSHPEVTAPNLRGSMTIPTKHGVIVGTPAYMAPEQWQGLPADARSDQFSFCVALYEALFDHRPFAGETVASLSRNVIERPPQTPPRSAPRWLRKLLLRGLSTRASARYPSMAALLEAMARGHRRTLGLAIAMGSVGFCALLATSVFVWTRANADTPAATREARATDTEHQACLAPFADAKGSWTRGRRETLARHLADMDEGEAVTARVLPALDAWAEAWTTLAANTCTVETPPPLERCLEAELARFDGFVRQASTSSGYEIANALPRAALELPALERCSKPTTLATFPAAPSPEQAGEARMLGNEVAALEVLIALQRWNQARELADHLLERAQTLAYAPLLAEVQLARGQIAADERLPASARQWLEAAAQTAQAGVHDHVHVQASLALVTELGAHSLLIDDAKRWLRVATSHAQRRQDPVLGGQVALAEARMLAAMAEHAPALERFTEAREQFEASEAPLASIRVRLDLEETKTRIALADLPGAARTAEHAERSALAHFGPRALLLAEAKATRAQVSLAQAELVLAASLAAEAVAIPGVGRSIRHDHDRGMYLGLHGTIARARGDLDQAREDFETAKVYFYAGPEQSRPLVWLGALAISEGQIEAGLATLELGASKLEPGLDLEDPRRLAPLRAIARAQHEAGALDLARATLSTALELANEALGLSALQAIIEAELGLVELAAGNDVQALALLDSSFVGMAGGLGPDHARVTTISLTRADLAWALGRQEYASGLYSGVARMLDKQRGAQDPATVRAMARKTRED